ncbi:hypothetical protein BBJ28_00011735 [Nothophytophthora sp. Chile5]|nr:hypothetical protein BBJ28_00011735 [Nothophytophthora sp. Chile5]
MLDTSSLQAIQKCKQRAAAEEGLRVPESQRLVGPLLTSWFDVTNYSDVFRPGPWRTSRMPAALAQEDMQEDLRAVGELSEESKEPINSAIKLRLYPTTTHHEKLEHMFATNRAVYNKMVARSKEDCATRLMLRGKASKDKKMTLAELGKKYRPAAQTKTMPAYVWNKRSLQRHLQVHDEVRESPFRTFMKTVKSSLALYFALRKKGKKTSFPELKFKSKSTPSNTIEIRSRGVTVVHGEKDYVRFHPTRFGFGKSDGIELREKLPEPTHSIRLQRLREGEYYIAVPRFVEFQPTQSSRVGAIDPSVRNFAMVYDPDGRTFSVKDAYTVLKRRFEVIDAMKSKLALMDNESKAKHTRKVRQRKKPKGENKTKLHRHCYRLRRCIRFTHHHVTRMVGDMHHKLSSWLAANYNQVLLPSFQTSEMVRKYEKLVATDGAPPTSSDAVKQNPTQGRKRKIRSSTARAMLAQSHFKFKMLLKCTMGRVGGRVIECGEEYTSRTCSSCGEIKGNLGGNSVYKCSSCHVVLDQDVNAAKNIFHKNMQMLG